MEKGMSLDRNFAVFVASFLIYLVQDVFVVAQ
jgi:hypothetical protein